MTGDVRYAVGQPRADEALFTRCPFHDDSGRPNLAVYPDGSWCFVCGMGETADQFLARIGHDGLGLPPAPERGSRRAHAGEAGADVQAVLRAFRSRVRIWHATLVEGPRVHRLPWLYARGLWLATIKRHLLGHTGERWSIPAWEWADPDRRTLATVKFRIDERYCDDDVPRYDALRGVPVAIFRPRPDGHTTVICEGELDALLLSQYGYDAITTTGGSGSLSKDLRHLALPRTLYIAVDRDDAGEQTARKLGEVFPGARRLVWDSSKDVTDALLTLDEDDRPQAVDQWIRTAIPLEGRR